MRKFTVASVALCALASVAPVCAQAQTPTQTQTQTMMECSASNMTTRMSSVEKMAAGEKKTEAMKQLGMAKDMMAKNDMAACKTHLNNAMMGDTIDHDGQELKK